MKTIALLLISIVCIAAKADIYYKNTFYLQCSYCSTDSQFLYRARSHYLNYYPDSRTAPDIKRYVLANLRTRVVRSVAVTRNNENHVNSSVEASFINNSAQTLRYFRDYRSSVLSLSRMGHFINVEGTGIQTHLPISNNENLVFLSSSRFDWSGNSQFLTNARSFIESRMVNINLNPFLFLKEPLFVRFFTRDRAVVYMYADDATSNSRQWRVFSVFQNRWLDQFGNLLSQRASLEGQLLCFLEITGSKFVQHQTAQEVCRGGSQTSAAVGGIYRHVGSNIVNTPNPGPPDSCDSLIAEICPT
ncbi:hypothetical protein [Pleionea sediminis]|uniref:hypothetical protein n=1 Tax=Pleionea sediminis TaxID=2569479 RepID=UPI001185478F|nr:hypothetical protein [Pleionea sediminis]